MNHQPPPVLGGQGRHAHEIRDCGRTMLVLTLAALGMLLLLAALTIAGGAS